MKPATRFQFHANSLQSEANAESEKVANSLQSEANAQFERELEKRVAMLVQEVSKLASENSKLKSCPTFLRLQFDNKPSSGALGGDVVIIVQGLTDQPLYAHKFILASKSPVLCKMLDTNMSEKAAGVLRIDDITLPVMRAVVKFCYDAQIEFTDEVAPESVLEAAHKYGLLDDLAEVCNAELAATISRANLPKMLKFAREYGQESLEDDACQFLQDNFEFVASDVLTEVCEAPVLSGTTWSRPTKYARVDDSM